MSTRKKRPPKAPVPPTEPEPVREGFVRCPPTLELTRAQMAPLIAQGEAGKVPPIRARFVAEQAKGGELRSLKEWRAMLLAEVVRG